MASVTPIPLTTDMIQFIEVPVPKGITLHPDVIPKKPGHILWPCVVFPDTDAYDRSWKAYNIFGETADEAEPVAKQVFKELMAITLSRHATAIHDPVAVLVGPKKFAAKKNATRVFVKPNPNDLLSFDENLWKFISLCGKVEGVQETLNFLMKLYQNTPCIEDVMDIEETAPVAAPTTHAETTATQEDAKTSSSFSGKPQPEGAAVTPSMSTVGEKSVNTTNDPMPVDDAAASQSEKLKVTEETIATPQRKDKQADEAVSSPEKESLLTQAEGDVLVMTPGQAEDAEYFPLTQEEGVLGNTSYSPLSQKESERDAMDLLDDTKEDEIMDEVMPIDGKGWLTQELGPESPATEEVLGLGTPMDLGNDDDDEHEGRVSADQSTKKVASIIHEPSTRDGSDKKNPKRKTSLESRSVLEGTDLPDAAENESASLGETKDVADQTPGEEVNEVSTQLEKKPELLVQPKEAPEHRQFSDVKKAFQRAGYLFINGLYCFPRMNPAKNRNAVENQDYFTTLKDFRKSLCEHGVAGDFGETDKEAIHEWVRMNIVNSVDQTQKLPPFKDLTNNEALDMLKRIGFQEHRIHGVGIYCYPRMTPQTGSFEDETMFHDDLGMRKHLARFGLPATCKWDELLGNVAEERFRLEMYLAKNIMHVAETFKDSYPASGRSKRRRDVSGTESVSSKSVKTPNTSKKMKGDTGEAKKNPKSLKKTKTPRKSDPGIRGVWSVPKFTEVKGILEKGGFSFSSGKFCRPGYTGENAKLGENYFETEEDFKKDLCQFGVNDYKDWTKADKRIVHDWVRVSIVSSFGKKRPSEIHYTKLSQAEIFSLFKQLGIEKKPMQVLNNEYYCFPGIDPNGANSVEGINVFQMDGEVRQFISRFGFPKACAFDKISTDDLLNLEMMMVDQHKDHTFKNYDRTIGMPRKRNRNNSAGQDIDRSKPSKQGRAGKTPKRKKLSRKKSTKKNATPGDNDIKTPGNAPEEQLKEPKRKAVHGNSDNSATESKENETSKAGGEKVEVPDPGKEAEDTQIEAANVVLTDKNIDDKTRLHLALDNLDISKPVDTSFFTGAGKSVSPFEKKLEEVQGFVHKSLTTSDEGQGCLYVCGVPGIGKTTGVLWSVNKAIANLDKKRTSVSGDDNNEDMDEIAKPVFCHINAAHLPTVSDTLETIMDQVGKFTGGKGKAENILKSGKIHAIVVIDEIENLLAKNLKKGFPASESEMALEQLIEMANDDDFNMTLIGISNAIGDEKFARFQGLGTFKIVTFGPYSEDDLKNILVRRIGKGIMEEGAVNYICKIASSQNGDARKAIKMASTAIKLCQEQLQPGTFSEGPLVTMKHVMTEVRHEKNKFTDIVQGCTDEMKLVLAILTALNKTGINKTTMSKLLSFVNTVLESNNGKFVDRGDFQILLETLSDQGLLKIEKWPENLAQQSQTPIELGASAEDIQKAVDSELRKQSKLYARLLDTPESEFAYLRSAPE